MDRPARFADVEALEDFMTAPSEALRTTLAGVPGNIMVLGAGGKMGPTLARMAKRAAPDKTVLAVARFSDPAVRERLQSQGVECISGDPTDRAAIARLPGPDEGFENVVFMAGHKLGAAGDPSYTWR
ncbi:MAG: NmrA family NAD(P)-binding protein [Burkholderiaceae bacterium]